jgi:type IV secretion system protein VirB10
MAENETGNLQEEQKHELGDEKKSTVASKGLGIIFVIFAILVIVYIIFSLKNGKKENDETVTKQAEQVIVKQKDFTQQGIQSNRFEPINNSSYNGGSQNPFGDNAGVAIQQQRQAVPKGLSGAAVPTSNKASQSDTSAAGGQATQSPAVAAANARAAELKQMAQSAQSQLSSLQAAALGGGGDGGGGSNSHEAGVIENTAVTVIAKKSTLDPNLALDKGTFISCVLKTAIISTIAGNIACIVTDDVYSAAGTVLLIEKGSVVQGSFRSGTLTPGMNRLFVIWEEIKTPKRVVIDVNAPATDALGGSGIDGWVDNHYMQRFGAAILLSMIDDAFSAAFNNRDGRDYTMNTRENTVDMANTALENTINIPPTLYKNQGDIVGIYVNKDVDFSKVYRLQRIWK